MSAHNRSELEAVARRFYQAIDTGDPAVVDRFYRACDIHRVVDGRIVRSWHLEDFFGLLTQLGATFGASAR